MTDAKPYRVLVVDDDHDGAAALTMLLEMMGAVPVVAHDALAALDLLPDFKPEVIISDVRMPGMDGDELATLIRSDDSHKDTLLVALTGLPGTKAHVLAAGFDQYILKPVGGDEIWKVIEGHCEAVRAGVVSQINPLDTGLIFPVSPAGEFSGQRDYFGN